MGVPARAAHTVGVLCLISLVGPARVWHHPDHQIRSEADPIEEPFIRAILPGGEDELHFAAGFGIALDRFQVDLAVDLSERIDTASISAIYSF